VHALAKELGLELIEVNASDFRNKEHIDATVGNASKQQSLFSRRGKVILVDEIDGLSGMEDRGGASALTALIETSGFPMVCTATDPFDQKFSDLRKRCEMVELKALPSSAVFSVLQHIATAEKLAAEEDDLKSLARRCGGDMRAAITDMQAIAMEKGSITKEDIDGLSQREQAESVISALLKVFKTTDPNVAMNAFDMVDEELDRCILWLDENLPAEYEKPADLARAYDMLSRADVMQARIRRWQHWRFLVYVNAYVTAGVAVAKDAKYQKFTQYRPTTRILKLWQAKMKYEKRKAIAAKVAAKTHTSARDAIQSYVPYLQAIFKKDRKMADAITEQLELADEEVAWLKA
jgi:replication factor C large subunit